MSLKSKKKYGFSLIEVLVFISLISLIFIAMSFIAVTSIRSSKFSERKILATYYAEELREWLRGEKEKDWSNFTKTGTYCFNTSPILTDCAGTWASCATSQNDCGNSYILGIYPNNIYRRFVIASTQAAITTRVDLNIKVEWKELNNNYQVPIDASFSLWE